MEWIARDGVRMHAIDQAPRAWGGVGPDDAAEPEVVLWLQGLNAPAAAWTVQIAHFGRTHRSIAPDQRGVGGSEAAPGPYSTRQLAEDAKDLLDACGVRRVHLVGLSLGGAAAQELALAWPERVRTLSLLATFARQSPRSRALLEAWRELYPAALAAPALRAAFEKQACAWLFSDRFWRGEANVQAALRFAAGNPPQSVVGFLGQLDAALAHDARARLPGLRVPTLVLHGALDQLAPPAGAEELAALIPGAQLQLVPEAGHAVNLEAQRAVHAALRAHWERGRAAEAPR